MSGWHLTGISAALLGKAAAALAAVVVVFYILKLKLTTIAAVPFRSLVIKASHCLGPSLNPTCN